MYPSFDYIDSYPISSSLNLIGYSIASHETGFYIPELKIFLDCGVVTKYCPNFIFITHGHFDHCGQLYKTLLEESCNPLVIVPEGSRNDIINSMSVMNDLSTGNTKQRIHSKYEIVGVRYNTELILNIKNHDWKIDIIKCFHSHPKGTCGYGFTELRNKLKSEFVGLEGREIAKLKHEGIEITEIIEYPQFCYLCDTTHKIFENEILLKFPVIMIECTFLKPEDKKKAKTNKHMHWDNLEPYIREHPEIRFILFHFSSKYHPYITNEVREFFEEYNDISSTTYLPNIFLWV